MVLRPAVAEWFELLTPREELTRVLHCLAETGAVELQTYSQGASREKLPDMQEGLARFGELSLHYGDWWPEPAAIVVQAVAEPAEQLAAALTAVEAWETIGAPLIVKLQANQQTQLDLAILRTALASDAGQLPDLEQLASSGPYLASRLYKLPLDSQLEQIPSSVLIHSVYGESARFVFAVGQSEQIQMLDEYMALMKARPLELPAWLPSEARAAIEEIDRRLEMAKSEFAELEEALQQSFTEADLAAALGRLRLLDWYVSHVPALPVTERFAWVTGWTSAPQAASVEEHLKAAGIDYLLRIAEPPPELQRPMIMRNPIWARPFELFAALLGTPGDADVDPSQIVAILAPLMFGYMFGDVGQGAVLLLVGLVMRGRYPVTGLLVPGGISAMLFGFAFGSVFGIETIIPALWLHPLVEPVPVLIASLVFGVVVVTLGLALDAHQCHWRGEDMEFWGARLGLPIAYFGLLAAIVFLDARGVWLALLGTLWFIVGAGLRRRPRFLPAAGNAAAEYLETVLQLLVNTISFVRIGAFALAHAGLCAAVVGMADGFQSVAGKAAVLLLGNALIIGLEGLVVSIQTTRLVLFEFFIRFLRSSARSFQPLPRLVHSEPSTKRREK